MMVLQADEKVYHKQVVEVMDAAKQAGISRLAIATRSKSADQGSRRPEKKARAPASPERDKEKKDTEPLPRPPGK